MREIIVSKIAQSKLIDIAVYIESRFSLKTRIEFINKFHKTILLLQKNPESFPKSEINKTLFKCLMSKQTTLYYKFNSHQIRILAVFDTRQNPKKIKKIK